MKVIIAGSREGFSLEDVERACKSSNFDITEVVSGTARGVDRLGEQWAVNSSVKVKRFPADWDTLGKRAGYVRNIQMAEYAEALIALWDGSSKGTAHMIKIAEDRGLRIFVYGV